MRFSTAPVVACLAGLAASQQYTVVVKNINTLTTKSQALIVPAGQLSISNAPELLLGLGPWPVRSPPQSLIPSARTSKKKKQLLTQINRRWCSASATSSPLPPSSSAPWAAPPIAARPPTRSLAPSVASSRSTSSCSTSSSARPASSPRFPLSGRPSPRSCA